MFTPPPNVSEQYKEIIAAYNSGWVAAMRVHPPSNPYTDGKLKQAWRDGFDNSKHESVTQSI